MDETGDGPTAAVSVEVLLAGAAEFDEIGLEQLGESHGNAALAHAEDLLEFDDGKLLAFEEPEHADSAFVTEEAERFEEAGHIVFSSYQ